MNAGANRGSGGGLSFTPPRSRAAAVLFVLMVGGSGLSVAGATPPTFTGLGTVTNAAQSEANAVSSSGYVVVGWTDSGTGRVGFRYDRRTAFQDLGVAPGALSSEALGVCVSGHHVVGVTSTPQGDRASWWYAGTMLNLGVMPGGAASRALGLSAGGVIAVGWSESTSGIHAFRWTSATGMQDLGVLPGGAWSAAHCITGDGVVIIGESDTPAGRHPFRWTGATGMQDLGLLPGTSGACARGISNNDLVIVGDATTPAGISRPFWWSAETGMIDLGVLADQVQGVALGVSSVGQVTVGYGSDAAGARRALVWDVAEGTADLREELSGRGVNMNGWSLTEARGISADGTVIVGAGIHNGRSEGWIATLPPCQGAGVTSGPAPRRAAFRSPVTLTAGVEGDAPMTIQWRRNGTPIVDGDGITGSNTPSLTINSVRFADEGSYDVVVSNYCGAQTSAAAVLDVYCAADWNGSGVVNSQDFFDFLAAFFASDASADFNHDAALNSQDFFDFLGEFFTPCP